MKAGPTSPRETSGLQLDASQSICEWWPERLSTELQPHSHFWGQPCTAPWILRGQPKPEDGWGRGLAPHGCGRGMCRDCKQGITAAASHQLWDAHSSPVPREARLPLPRRWLQGRLGTGVCRAFPQLRCFAAEGLAATWLRWQQEPRWPCCMLMSRDGLSPLEPCTQLLGLGTRGTHSTRQGWWQVSSICSAGLHPLQASL